MILKQVLNIIFLSIYKNVEGDFGKNKSYKASCLAIKTTDHNGTAQPGLTQVGSDHIKGWSQILCWLYISSPGMMPGQPWKISKP